MKAMIKIILEPFPPPKKKNRSDGFIEYDVQTGAVEEDDNYAWAAHQIRDTNKDGLDELTARIIERTKVKRCSTFVDPEQSFAFRPDRNDYPLWRVSCRVRGIDFQGLKSDYRTYAERSRKDGSGFSGCNGQGATRAACSVRKRCHSRENLPGMCDERQAHRASQIDTWDNSFDKRRSQEINGGPTRECTATGI